MVRVALGVLAGPGASVRDAVTSAGKAVDGEIVVGVLGAPPVDHVSTLLAAPVRSFAALRNTASDAALDLHEADWILFCDADERLIVRDADGLRAWLEALPPDVLGATVENPIGMFRQTKIHRAGLTPWIGYVHEYAPIVTRPVPASLLEVVETPKSAEQYTRKIERDRRLLVEQERDDPESDRWPFYLGETHRLACQWETARHWYRTAIQRRKAGPWGAECAGWAAFKSARCGWDGRAWDPVEDLVLGMMHCPWMPELPWFAAWVRLQQGGKADEVRAWASMARAVQGTGPSRLGFREDAAHDPEEISKILAELDARRD